MGDAEDVDVDVDVDVGVGVGVGVGADTASAGARGDARGDVQGDTALADMLGRVVRRIVRRGRAELGRAARSGRTQLERRQAQKDLDHFWVRLGKTAFRLVEAGEIDHPALRRAMVRIEELEAQLDTLRAAHPGVGEGSATTGVDPSGGTD